MRVKLLTSVSGKVRAGKGAVFDLPEHDAKELVNAGKAYQVGESGESQLNAREILSMAIDRGVVEQNGPWIKFREETLGQGYENVVNSLSQEKLKEINENC